MKLTEIALNEFVGTYLIPSLHLEAMTSEFRQRIAKSIEEARREYIKHVIDEEEE